MNDETLKEQINKALARLGCVECRSFPTDKEYEFSANRILQLIAQAKIDELTPLLSNVPLDSLSYDYLITRLDSLRSKL